MEEREGRRAVKRESGNWGLRGCRRGSERERKGRGGRELGATSGGGGGGMPSRTIDLPSPVMTLLYVSRVTPCVAVPEEPGAQVAWIVTVPPAL